MREAVLRDAPDAVPLIRALHREGLIEGWRDVLYVGPPRDLAGAVRGPFMGSRVTMPKE